MHEGEKFGRLAQVFRGDAQAASRHPLGVDGALRVLLPRGGGRTALRDARESLARAPAICYGCCTDRFGDLWHLGHLSQIPEVGSGRRREVDVKTPSPPLGRVQLGS